ncbi:MAG TPA: putative lipid II flippase FtsW [Pseudomonas sp.]|jgi:cell division protein FtsW|nr:putative lipid II flippase FtsW [Pseudomonas sp.]
MMTFLRPYPSPLLGPRGVDLDLPLLVGCLMLLGLGLVMVTSASSEVAAAQAGGPLYYGIRQAIFLGIGLIAGVLVLMVPIATWQRLGWVLLAAAFLLLVLVLAVGREINGSIRWIHLGPLSLQASELAKVFVVIYLAGYLVRRQEEVRESWSGFLKPIAVLIPMAGLLLLEPDFGATVVLFGAAAGMLFLGGVGLVRFGLSAILAVGAVWLLVKTQPYRVARLTTFTDPWADQFGAGYQLTQALIAFGRGEWFGVGLGNSIQKQFYLPEAHTDFVFAILAEELGMVGALATLALLVFVCLRALYIGLWAEQAKQHFAAYVAYGLAILWIGQILINIGVNVGLLPTKGLTLPFLSYGGSSLMICCVSLAMLLRIDWERRQLLRGEVEIGERELAGEGAVHAR